MEVEVLMKRMVELQQQEEECTQEEMVTRFERERSESIPTGTYMATGMQTCHLSSKIASSALSKSKKLKKKEPALTPVLGA